MQASLIAAEAISRSRVFLRLWRDILLLLCAVSVFVPPTAGQVAPKNVLVLSRGLRTSVHQSDGIIATEHTFRDQ